jgi:hypothetical protein
MVLCPDGYWPPYLAREASGLKYTGSGAPALPTAFWRVRRRASNIRAVARQTDQPAMATNTVKGCRLRDRILDHD